MSTLYLEAAKVLSKVERRNAGIRSVLYSEKQNKRNIRKLSALAHGVSRRRRELEAILKGSRLLEDSSVSKVSNYWLLLVLTYEQLFGSLRIQGGGALARLVRSNKDKLYECLSREYPELLVKETGSSGAKEQIPRYLRVNTSVESTDSVFGSILEQLRRTNQFEGEDLQEHVWIDKDIKDVIVCRHEVAKLLCLDRTPSSNELIQASKVALQDKGSCFSAICASITSGDFVLDACSAPGSKTLHVIDMLNRRGRLVALDKDSGRIRVLIRRVSEVPYLLGPFILRDGALELTETEQITDELLSSQAGCIFLDKESGLIRDGGVETGKLSGADAPELLIHVALCDFLTLTPKDDDRHLPWVNYKNTLSGLRTIILDPSCSGSGLPQHGKVEKEHMDQRLKGLSEFQTKMLVHSLTSFPSVKTVCYSTCSVFAEENEQVVLNSLEKCKGQLRFSLDFALEGWENPPKSYQDGSSLAEIHKRCLFVDPETHRCRGFFLAKFVDGSNRLLKNL